MRASQSCMHMHLALRLQDPALQVQAASFARCAACFERPVARECCAAAGWVRQRVAASEWAVHDYHCQHIQQVGHGRWYGAGSGGCPGPPSPPTSTLSTRFLIFRGSFFFLSVLSFAVHNITSAGHSLTCPRLPPPQIKEELAAAEARRPALIVAQPGLRLDLPAALQQPPPRLDMCSVCAGRFEKVGHWGAGGAELGRWTAWIRFAVRLDSMACAC